MYISKKNRELIKQKFEGKCAYSGTVLQDDWQVDHIEPVRRNFDGKTAINESAHNIENMVPCQSIVNHYKGSLLLSNYRQRLVTLHLRLSVLPKNPKSIAGIKRKKYLLKVAEFFGITEDTPFDGKFYFETFKD